MYFFHEHLTPFSSIQSLYLILLSGSLTLLSCLSLTVCFAVRKIAFWCSESFKSLEHSFCFFFCAEAITLFAFCLLFLYSFHASIEFSLFHFPYFISFPLLLHQLPHSTNMFAYGIFDIPHMSFVVFIIIFFICCQLASVHLHQYFHYASSTLSLTMLLYSSHVFSSLGLSFYTRTLGSNVLTPSFCFIKLHVLQ